MSFFGMGRPQPTSAEKIAAVEQNMKLMADMHNRMIAMCSQKCVPKDYREGELNKGESVCLDRCASKFFEAHQIVSQQLEKESAQRGGGAPVGGFGM
ncbi:protein transporter tim10 [Coniochaeta pulveracea]|uniref:Mitochondrial import inner membrane translocase subunit n=1 Tax=Coniochaeta pulveracea TaxID=177199 RepID=A0A420Y9P8_9PEZI|nr:protein transporter tim10 [Coniochaeta pulveracea]